MTTLGAHLPRGTIVSVPDRSTYYWLPCIRPILGVATEHWLPHCYFIADSRDPHALCPEHRTSPRTSPGAPGSSQSAPDVTRPVVAAEAPEAPAAQPGEPGDSPEPFAAVDPPKAVPPATPEATSAPIRPTPRSSSAAGLPPWAGDLGGRPLWERVGGEKGRHLREHWSERAAIHEYLGGLSREYAEYLAYGRLLDQAARGELP